ncbi:putative dehydrogenase [Chitinophaga sp. W2I13]|uniref:Gfo/Idh/MocA family protein n=1 Tax=Chitinophaga sp. W2I13 TaxID=3373923 RepID=UPI003D1982DF
MEEIKWGIIGCGDVTEVKSGPAFNKVPHSSLVAVMRRDAAKAQDYALRHGVPKWYDNAEQLINDPEINAVYIATPPLQHEEYTLLALSKGKPVYVEKPMTLNAASAIRMKAAADKYHVKLSVAHYPARAARISESKRPVVG